MILEENTRTSKQGNQGRRGGNADRPRSRDNMSKKKEEENKEILHKEYAFSVIVNGNLTQSKNSLIVVTYPTEQPHDRVSVVAFGVGFVLIGNQLIKTFKMAGYLPDRPRMSY